MSVKSSLNGGDHTHLENSLVLILFWVQGFFLLMHKTKPARPTPLSVLQYPDVIGLFPWVVTAISTLLILLKSQIHGGSFGA